MTWYWNGTLSWSVSCSIHSWYSWPWWSEWSKKFGQKNIPFLVHDEAWLQGRHCAGWPSPSCPSAGHKGMQSRMKSSWNVGATDLGSCWQRVFRLTAVNVLQIALNCHIEDLGQIPCPKGKKKQPSGARSQALSKSAATSKNHSSVLTVLQFLLLFLDTQHQHWALGLEI